MSKNKIFILAVLLGMTGMYVSAQNVVKQKYNLVVLSNDATQGSVEGGGSYSPSHSTVITAFPQRNYRFSHWSDGVYDNPRTVTVMSDTTIRAIFAYTGCVVNVKITPEGAGTATGAGKYSPGDSVVVVARPNPGYTFACSVDKTEITHTFKARYNATYNITVKFMPKGTDPASYQGKDTGKDVDEDVVYNRDINLYPNPVEDELTVSGTYMYKIDLYMVGGQLVKSYPEVNARFFNIDVRKLPAGSYYLSVETARGMFTRKFIKR
ncbi:MAG: T9SS type A sorting domain-containing protein [Bacteroidales bacterium]|nr:T9SS type A sorting domain-containing protein [Bacteroidales bacterium]